MYLSVATMSAVLYVFGMDAVAAMYFASGFPLTLGLYSQPDVSRWNRLCKRRNSGVAFLGLTLGFRPFEFVLGSIEE